MYTFAIIGCGRIAARHAENIAKRGKLLAVCDNDKAKADAFAQSYNAKAYYSIDELLAAEKALDIIAVCTPNGLHAEHTIKSLQAGKHVLCEKPLCITTVAGSQMVDTAFFNRRKLFVVKQNRYNQPVQLVKQALDNGDLGSIYSFSINCVWNRPQAYYTGDWKGTPFLDGGVLYTQFSHFIDLLYWYLGEVETAKGFKKTFAEREHFAVEDSGAVALQMKNGAIGTLHYTINSYDSNAEGSFTLIGEKGTVKIGGQYLNTLEWFKVSGKDVPNITKEGQPNDYGFYQGSMSNHDKVYDELLLSLNGRGSLVEGRDAVKTIEIIEKIYAATEAKEA